MNCKVGTKSICEKNRQYMNMKTKSQVFLGVCLSKHQVIVTLAEQESLAVQMSWVKPYAKSIELALGYPSTLHQKQLVEEGWLWLRVKDLDGSKAISEFISLLVSLIPRIINFTQFQFLMAGHFNTLSLTFQVIHFSCNLPIFLLNPYGFNNHIHWV